MAIGTKVFFLQVHFEGTLKAVTASIPVKLAIISPVIWCQGPQNLSVWMSGGGGFGVI